LKLLILSQYFYPETGAPQNRLLELSNGFRSLGWEVKIVTAMPNYPKGKIFEEYRGKFIAKESIEGNEILRFPLIASNSSRSIPRIISMLSFSFSSLFSNSTIKKFKPDFLFVESPPLTLAYSGYLLSKFSGSRLIMNVSDVWPLSAKELGFINEGYLYDKLVKLEEFLYRKSYLVTGQSEEIVKHIKESGGKNVYLFRNGVDIRRFESPQSKNTSGDLKIVYAGLIGVAQGIFELSKNINFKELGAEFHIYGEGPEKQMLTDFLVTNPGRNIYLHKSVRREEIPGVLKQYDCTIIPLVNNIYGAVPSKIYEAMATGLPVLFSGTGEGAKIIKDNKAGLISGPKDFESLKKNILQLKNSPLLRVEMSRSGRRTAEGNFDRNQLINELSEFLQSSVN
jgi:glycosyltransferase involved in cell wall biosynthesis